jgi:hypothetical protein
MTPLKIEEEFNKYLSLIKKESGADRMNITRLNELKFQSLEKKNLSLEEEKQVVKFINLLNSSENVYILYRGENTEFLEKKYNKEDIFEIARYIFNIGEKADHFLTRSIAENEYETLISEFKNLIDKLKKKSYDRYFLKYDIKNFENIINDLNESDFINYKKLFFYYYSLLHNKDRQEDSMVVSTSCSRLIAESAATHNRKYKSGIILYLFAPNRLLKNGYIIKQTKINELNKLDSEISKLIRDKDYPRIITYENKENEFFIFKVIFPHFILGIELLEEKVFIPNPEIFKESELETVLENGLSLDQSKFGEYINETSFKRYMDTYDFDVFKGNDMDKNQY